MNKTSSGKYAIRRAIVNIININGRIVLVEPLIVSPEMAHAMNNVTPTGGVARPIASTNTIRTPKCTGSTPTWVTAGRSIGTRIINAGVGSKNVPIIKRNMQIRVKRICGL